MIVIVPPEIIGVVGVNVRVIGTDFPIMRSGDEISKDTNFNCPKIAGNVNPSCACNGDPFSSNVEILTFATAAETCEFVNPEIEHKIGIKGATGEAAFERFNSSRPDVSEMSAATDIFEIILWQTASVALLLTAEKRKLVTKIILKRTVGSKLVAKKETWTVTLVASEMSVDRKMRPPGTGFGQGAAAGSTVDSAW